MKAIHIAILSALVATSAVAEESCEARVSQLEQICINTWQSTARTSASAAMSEGYDALHYSTQLISSGPEDLAVTLNAKIDGAVVKTHELLSNPITPEQSKESLLKFLQNVKEFRLQNSSTEAYNNHYHAAQKILSSIQPRANRDDKSILNGIKGRLSELSQSKP